MDKNWQPTPPGPLYGKRIVRAWVGGIDQGAGQYSSILKDEKYDDEPFFYIELDTGEIFRFVSFYGGYTGNSDDEYPRYIRLEAKVKE
jgi:hypothetical protein